MTSGIALNNERHVHMPEMLSTDLDGHISVILMENETQSSGVSGPVIRSREP